MKATTLVSHLHMDDAMHVKGDIVDYPEERIVQLGSSVKAITNVPIPIPVDPKEPEPIVKEAPKSEPRVVDDEVVDSEPKRRGRPKKV